MPKEKSTISKTNISRIRFPLKNPIEPWILDYHYQFIADRLFNTTWSDYANREEESVMQHRPRNVYHLSAVAGRFTRLGMICGVNTRMEAGRRPRGEKDGERGGWKRALWRRSSHDSLHDPVCRACCQARNACSRLRSTNLFEDRSEETSVSILSRNVEKLFLRFLFRFSSINILEIYIIEIKDVYKTEESFSSKFFHLF